MFRLPKIISWRYQSADGTTYLLSPIEAEARFRHEEMWGRNRAPYLTPVFERDKKARVGSGLVVSMTQRALVWLSAMAAGCVYHVAHHVISL